MTDFEKHLGLIHLTDKQQDEYWKEVWGMNETELCELIDTLHDQFHIAGFRLKRIYSKVIDYGDDNRPYPKAWLKDEEDN